MLNKKLEEALNAQINAEFWSAYLYLSMSSDMNGRSGKLVCNSIQRRARSCNEVL